MNAFYIASKLFTYLVLPPGIFIIFFLLASIYAKKFKTIFFLFALSFYALSNSLVATWLLEPFEKPYNKPLEIHSDIDAVVILSGGSVSGSANIPVASDAYKRVMWGLMIAKSQNLPVLFSGAGIEQKYSEADAFLDSAKELRKYLHVDIPTTTNLELNNFSILLEDKSIDTYENAKFSYEMFKKRGIEKPKIYLVTSAFHMKRSVKLYEHFGFEVIPAATGFKIDYKEQSNWDYLPNIGALNRSYTAIHEYTGIASLILRGVF